MACFTDPSSIPRISELLEILGYANSEVPGFVAFHDAYQAFHKTFFTKQDRKGTTLHDWQNDQHRLGLRKMAVEFLGYDGYGRKFWPDEDAGSRTVRLRYPVDKITITQYLQQLFWRLEEQQHSKTKTTLNERGHTYENPIYVDDDEPQEVELNGEVSSFSPNKSPESTVHSRYIDPSLSDLDLVEARKNLPNGHEVGDRGLKTLITKAQGQHMFANMSIIPVDDRQCAPYAHMAPEIQVLQQQITNGSDSSSRVLPAELASNALHSTVLALKQADRIPSSAVVRSQGSTDNGVQQPAITNQTTHTASAQLSTLKADCEINWAVMVFSGGEEARLVWVKLAIHIVMDWQAKTPDEEDLFVSLEFEMQCSIWSRVDVETGFGEDNADMEFPACPVEEVDTGQKAAGDVWENDGEECRRGQKMRPGENSENSGRGGKADDSGAPQ
ncbi:hypothetical protein CABS01_16558 [Colletotrichum abscissum]|uniref:uncharacterized protein n=1 Tax=Colletotrichum abscissum TaxID=1671311 RepID=UPI0027D6EFFC|nr:uncharacterized protein CABS01_16558 [Colletotrichum abscissum]KAK1520017.1 hypothetical protein CABS01_16558 [Colletotrichum abscissum]